jgi:hypothetical protein
VWPLGLALTLLVVAPKASAAPPEGQPFRLEYWARGQCPDAAEFARQIQTRAPRLRPAEGDEPALGFYAELDARGGSATGRLTARSPDGREVRREVHGTTCDDVVTALALIAALAADPTQPVEASPPPEPRRRAPRPPKEHLDEPRSDALPEPIVPEPVRRWTFGVGVGLAFDSSIAPSPGYGLSVALEVEAPEGPEDSAFRPFFSLSANRAAAARTETSGGNNAAFTWLAFRLTACPLRWPEQTPLFLRPCAFFDAGELEGSVSLEDQSIAPPGVHGSDVTHPWFALGAFSRVEALVGEVVSLQLDGGVTAPLRHDEFSAGPGAPAAFVVPSAGILGRIGLSYRFQ